LGVADDEGGEVGGEVGVEGEAFGFGAGAEGGSDVGEQLREMERRGAEFNLPLHPREIEDLVDHLQGVRRSRRRCGGVPGFWRRGRVL